MLVRHWITRFRCLLAWDTHDFWIFLLVVPCNTAFLSWHLGLSSLRAALALLLILHCCYNSGGILVLTP